MTKHTVSVLVENHFGVLARVAGLFSARGFNIDSLAVGETHDASVSRMTIVVHGNEAILEQIMKQLNKLIDVIEVKNLDSGEVIDRELVLVKVNCNVKTRSDVMQIVNTFRAKIVDVGEESMAIEVTGSEGKIDAMLELLIPFGIREVVRTGTIALGRQTELSIGSSAGKIAASVKPTKKAAKSKKTAKKKRKAAAKK